LNYSTVLDLDRKIRDYPIPEGFLSFSEHDPPGLAMQKGLLSLSIEGGMKIGTVISTKWLTHLRRSFDTVT